VVSAYNNEACAFLSFPELLVIHTFQCKIVSNFFNELLSLLLLINDRFFSHVRNASRMIALRLLASINF
jgi:hypothetical protein